jgi:hypothetical protein
VYEAFVEQDEQKPDDDEEQDNEDEINISMTSPVLINCDKLCEFSVRIIIYLQLLIVLISFEFDW